MEELTFIKDDKKSLSDILKSNFEVILPMLFYTVGLLIASSFFNDLKTTFMNDIMKNLFVIDRSNFEVMMLNRFCLYFSIFALTVILGMCLIGFPFLNVIPLFIGLEVGLKVSYYYVNYSAKGIAFALLMIIPQVSALLTIIIFTIIKSLKLSKYIYTTATQKTDITEEINLKLYLKSFAVYSLIIVLISLINTTLYYLLGSIISI